MTVISFPKLPLPPHLADLRGYDAEAARRGVQTLTIQKIDAEEAVKQRVQRILELPEIEIFGKYSNPLSMHFAFQTRFSVDEVRAQTVAIRKALAEIGIAGMALEEKENPND